MPLIIAHETPSILHHFHHQPISNKLTQTLHLQRNEKSKSKIMHEEHSSLYAFKTKTNLSSYTNITNIGILSSFFIFSKKTTKRPCHCITAILQISKVLHPPVIQCTNWSHKPMRRHEEQKPRKISLWTHLFKQEKHNAFILPPPWMQNLQT